MATAPESATELLQLVHELDSARLCKAYRKPPLPSRLLREMFEIGDREGIRFIATYPLSPSDLLEALIQSSDDPIALTAAALNPRVPVHILSQLAASPITAVRAETATNPQLSPRDLRILARDLELPVRLAVTRNPSLRPQLLAELVFDGEPAVRAAVAAHPNLPAEARYVLTGDPSPIVRCALVAATEDEELLLFWAERDDLLEQQALLTRKTLSAEVRATLLHSPHGEIRTAVLEGESLEPALQLSLVREGGRDERLWLARQPELPRPLQRLLAQDPEKSVRTAIAERADLDPDLAEHFVTMHDLVACEALALNPATAHDLLEQLARSALPSIPPLLAYREDLPRDVCELLLEGSEGETFIRHLACADPPLGQLPRLALNPYRQHPLPTVRAFVARTAALDSDEREELLNDPVAIVRLALVANPDLTDLELEELIEDPDEIVALTARDRWRLPRRRQTATPSASPASEETPEPEVDEADLPPAESDSPSVLKRLKRIFT